MNNKFSSGLVQKVAEDAAFDDKQKKLKEKLDIAEEKDIVVVEKNTPIKFVMRLLISFVKVLITIVILSLATIGAFTLLYPNIREQLIIVFKEILKTIF